MKIKRSEYKSLVSTYNLSAKWFYNGTKADLKSGVLIEHGFNSNFGKRKKTAYVYLTTTLGVATWGADL